MPTIRYHHTAKPQLTVGQLKALLADVPDDRPVMVQFGEGHPKRGIVDYQVVVHAGVLSETKPDGTVLSDHSCTIVADFETGDYEYETWDDEEI